MTLCVFEPYISLQCATLARFLTLINLAANGSYKLGCLHFLWSNIFLDDCSVNILKPYGKVLAFSEFRYVHYQRVSDYGLSNYIKIRWGFDVTCKWNIHQSITRRYPERHSPNRGKQWWWGDGEWKPLMVAEKKKEKTLLPKQPCLKKLKKMIHQKKVYVYIYPNLCLTSEPTVTSTNYQSKTHPVYENSKWHADYKSLL